MKTLNDNLAKEILDIEHKLNSCIPSTLWISDLHGEGDKFVRIIRGRFGMLYQTCKEALPHFFSKEKIAYIAYIIKKNGFEIHPKIKMDVQDVIQCLVDILKYKLENVRTNLFQKNNIFTEAIQMLVTNQKIPNLWYEEKWFSHKLISYLSKSILKVFLNHLVVLGDIFDRGAYPDKIVRILQNKTVKKNMSLVLGNHDVLWLGACAGNQSLIAEAIRITCRYDHLSFLDRLGIDYSKLIKFAEKTYPAKNIKGNYKAKTATTKSMEKALSIIQFKLEETTIKNHPEYEMNKRLLLNNLAKKLQLKDTEDLLDTHFPTLDFTNPQKLSLEEQEIINDLKQQFLSNSKVRNCISIFFEMGKTYHIYNKILSIHALIPSDKDGKFESFLGYKGKALLDYIQQIIARVGKNYLYKKPSQESDLSLLFYLWCGHKSPLFGKDSMKTFERYFFKDKKTHQEKVLFWNSNLEKSSFKQKLKNEFCINQIVYGHIPVDYGKGQKIASKDGFAINIDGGFANAYLNRGHALVQTAKQLYGIILHSEKEQVMDSFPEQIELIEEYSYPQKIKDTHTGNLLQKKMKQLKGKIANSNK